MSLSFQERFKNRMNIIGKLGEIDISTSEAILKPLPSQVFSSGPLPKLQDSYSSSFLPTPLNARTPSLKSAAPRVNLDPLRQNGLEILKTPRIKNFDYSMRKQTLSAAPLKNLVALKNNEIFQENRKNNFKPYTLKDYQNIKTDKYYELGGLGPANIGTEDWKLRKQALEKRIDYSRQIQLANYNAPVMIRKGNEPETEISKREKAIQFAKRIPKPRSDKTRSKADPSPPLSTILEELEKQKMNFKASIEVIKSANKL